jgi:hypothetical protein
MAIFDPFLESKKGGKNPLFLDPFWGVKKGGVKPTPKMGVNPTPKRGSNRPPNGVQNRPPRGPPGGPPRGAGLDPDFGGLFFYRFENCNFWPLFWNPKAIYVKTRFFGGREKIFRIFRPNPTETPSLWTFLGSEKIRRHRAPPSAIFGGVPGRTPIFASFNAIERKTGKNGGRGPRTLYENGFGGVLDPILGGPDPRFLTVRDGPSNRGGLGPRFGVQNRGPKRSFFDPFFDPFLDPFLGVENGVQKWGPKSDHFLTPWRRKIW